MTTSPPNSIESSQNTVLSNLLQSNLPQSAIFQATWTVVRVSAGLLMIHNGLDKLADVSGFANGVVKFMGLPYPVFLTYCAAYTEILGSVLLIIGALTRLSAASLLFTMFIALYFHFKKTGIQIPPIETASLYGLCFLTFLIGGGGAVSVDRLLIQVFKKSA